MTRSRRFRHDDVRKLTDARHDTMRAQWRDEAPVVISDFAFMTLMGRTVCRCLLCSCCCSCTYCRECSVLLLLLLHRCLYYQWHLDWYTHALRLMGP